MAEQTCFIALGSNLGDRPKNLARARLLLADKVVVIKTSSIYETDPWGVTDQPRFLNQVVEGKTSMTAADLLRFLKQIEQELGRRKTYRYGPRTIDLDILILGDLVMDTSDLTIPHPRIAERAFVLVPLSELAPDLLLPGSQKTIRDLLAASGTSGVKLYEGAV